MKRVVVLAGICGLSVTGWGQSILFNFDNIPAHTPFPTDVTVSGLTAHLSGTGQGYSIQRADTMGFTPSGFSGNCIYPSSVFPADLLIGFSQSATDFNIMFAPQELACDSTATMRVTAYENGVFVGTNTAQAPNPGTWPTGVLAFTSNQGFNSVVVHYDAPPPTGGDYGPIFLADNMNVTPVPEPMSLAILGIGLAGTIAHRRRRGR